MAGNNAREIRVAGNGRILVANLGTLPPTDTVAEWGSGWKDLGYTTTDGVKLAKKDKIDPIDTWQSVSAARFVYSDRDLTLKFQLLQMNEDTLPFFFGGGTRVRQLSDLLRHGLGCRGWSGSQVLVTETKTPSDTY